MLALSKAVSMVSGVRSAKVAVTTLLASIVIVAGLVLPVRSPLHSDEAPSSVWHCCQLNHCTWVIDSARRVEVNMTIADGGVNCQSILAGDRECGCHSVAAFLDREVHWVCGSSYVAAPTGEG